MSSRRAVFVVLVVVAALGMPIAVGALWTGLDQTSHEPMPYSEFVWALHAGIVDRVEQRDNELTVVVAANGTYQVIAPTSADAAADIASAPNAVEVTTATTWPLPLVIALEAALVLALSLWAGAVLRRRSPSDGGEPSAPRASWPTRILLALAIIGSAIPVAAVLWSLFSIPAWIDDGRALFGLPGRLVVSVLAGGIALAGLIWTINIFLGPDDEPPPWRFRDR